jgi:hypothetical protein
LNFIKSKAYELADAVMGDARPFTLQGLGKQVRWQIPMKTLYAKEAKPGKCSKSVVIHLLDELRRL